MKKVISLMLAATISLSMSACGENDPTEDIGIESDYIDEFDDTTEDFEVEGDPIPEFDDATDDSYVQSVENLDLNKTVIISSKTDSSSEIEVSVLGFEKCDWKTLGGILFDDLTDTEEIGLLKLVVKNISVDGTDVFFNNFLSIYDEDEIALTSISYGYNCGSFDVAPSEVGEINMGEKKKIAIPYVYDTSNKTLNVILGGKYSVTLPIK